MNWTTTTVPLWAVDCAEYVKVGRPFELRDVTTDEHLRFVELFAARHNLKATTKGTTVLFEREKAN